MLLSGLCFGRTAKDGPHTGDGHAEADEGDQEGTQPVMRHVRHRPPEPGNGGHHFGHCGSVEAGVPRILDRVGVALGRDDGMIRRTRYRYHPVGDRRLPRQRNLIQPVPSMPAVSLATAGTAMMTTAVLRTR